MAMFTPRQVSMGNKVYKLHVRHDALKTSISVPPDYSILQLKEKIYAETKVPPGDQILHCNGKLLDVSDLVTLKQAKIPNGSKINCSRVNRPVNKPLSVEDVEVDELLQKLEHIEKRSNDLEKCVSAVDKERKRLTNEELPLFHTESDKVTGFKKLKLECGKNGEQLMQLLEGLDQLVFTETQAEHRAKRKQVATMLNSVLDKNDKIIDRLSQAINKSE